MNSLTQTKLPRWRGFNLIDMFATDPAWQQFFPFESQGRLFESDFQMIAELGFDFVRIPVSYLFLCTNGDPYRFDEKGWNMIDQAVCWGEKYGLHVCLNLHRAPGYCITHDGKEEKQNLWREEEPLAAFQFLWESFARRYKGISSDRISFDLVNEPPKADGVAMTRVDHERVIRRIVTAIRTIDPDRLIIIDGVDVALSPCPELSDLHVGQSLRGYLPYTLTHYKCEWWDTPPQMEPVWPGMPEDGKLWDRSTMENYLQPWIELAKSGVGVHCGEMGCLHFTPHNVMLNWADQFLELLTAHGIGYALWNFRGPFGIVDNWRKDAYYVDFKGYQLDIGLFRLLQKY